eukprot:CAMPEP_0194073910 /NCGR_PEP_ID=MMETSP0149-20130528/1122_1 /TAXON_ID=122233 /ORGANISM="Chaetoceros debilis, Strain MM31A-1" /LENGTH=1393 /DNA_ID=CAMNT_0038753963 /DNA_START=143 /DNA_END=4324 /DNA_ORIENTATION=+
MSVATPKSPSSSSGTEELYHTNLLRLQATQLLSESILPISSQIGMLENEVKWAKDVWKYMDNVKTLISSMEEAVLSPDDVVVAPGCQEKNTAQKLRIQLHSDKARRHTNGIQNWTIPFPGGEELKITPINSYIANGAGLTTFSANANVIPTLDLAILLPVKSKFEDGSLGQVGIVGEKDYMNGRYFDKRNILAIHVAKFLAQKKQRTSIGSVHVVNELDGDFKKISLILTPPFDLNKKRNKDGSQKKKKSKQRFRVRLVFGAQYEGIKNTPDTNTGWMPCARLFPDRCNNKVAQINGQEITSDATPTYNNSLAIDMHYIVTSDILASVSSMALKVFSESWALLKIWCLQRGFLRGHDTFSNTTLGLSLAYLYRSKRVSSRMDSIQVFTVWMKFMNDMDWLGNRDRSKKKIGITSKGAVTHSHDLGYHDLDILSSRGTGHRADVVMPEEHMTEKQTIINCIQNRLYASDYKQSVRSGKESGKSKTLLECFKTSTDAPIFLDPSMTINYFGNLSPSFIKEVQVEAGKALECIHFQKDTQTLESQAHRIDAFRQLFLENVRFWRRYDAYLTFDLTKLIIPKSESDKRANKFWGSDTHDVGNYESIVRGLLKMLNIALGDRALALRNLSTGNGEVHSPPFHSKEMKDIGTTVLVESDEIKMVPIRQTAESPSTGFAANVNSPVACEASDINSIVIGVRINKDTCLRVVDRGPPANDIKASADFVSLWGEERAELRRFKDGAIVHAVVWNEAYDKSSNDDYEIGEKVGQTVERIIRHIVGLHFAKPESNLNSFVTFKLKDLTSLVDGRCHESYKGNAKLLNSSDAAHKSMTNAFEKLSLFLKSNSLMDVTGPSEGTSKLGLPLSIDAVEALSPSLRYSCSFPQAPHPLLGSSTKRQKKVAGVVVGDPILIQIRFEGSSRWPSDTNAMGAAKCAMLLQIANGILGMKGRKEQGSSLFDGPINVSPTHIELGYSGYVWQVIVRADQELKMLSDLRNPSKDAVNLRRLLIKRHITASKHHFTIHSLNTKYAAAGPVIRLLNRWVAAHMLSGLMPLEATELIVASVFTDPAPLETPATISCGFMRCLELLGNHDWARSPLVVDPEGHINGEDRASIFSQFETIRGQDFKHGPPLYIISPNDHCEEDDSWSPSFTKHLPERVIMGRICALAKRSNRFLMNSLTCSSDENGSNASWASIFQESPKSLRSYSALFRVDPQIILESSSSATACDHASLLENDVVATPYRRTMDKRYIGPKALKKKMYKNLSSNGSEILYGWAPITTIVQKLRSQFGRYAVFFYNEFCPDVIAILWRPTILQRQPFSAMHSAFCAPIESDWVGNGLVTTNTNDILRSIRCVLQDVVVDTKVLDDKAIYFEQDEHFTLKKNVTKTAKKPKLSSGESTD